MRLLVTLLLVTARLVAAEPLLTNNILVPEPPAWLTESRVNRVVDKIQGKLEWDIRRIQVTFYKDASSFKRAHGSGDWIEAFFRREDSTIHLGPQIDSGRFDATFGHELVHVILAQKYKTAIPAWLEEGLANHLAEKGSVDYAWLAKQPPRDVTSLGHPFKLSTNQHYHYAASHAVAQMVEAKCDLHDLLQMSVGRSFELYLGNICGITDVNAAFQEWVAKKSGPTPKPTRKWKKI